MTYEYWIFQLSEQLFIFFIYSILAYTTILMAVIDMHLALLTDPSVFFCIFSESVHPLGTGQNFQNFHMLLDAVHPSLFWMPPLYRIICRAFFVIQ